MDIQLRELNFEIIFLGDDFNIELSDDPIILEFEHEEKETIEDNIEKFLLENLETLIKPFIPVLPEVKDGKTPKKGVDYFDGEDGVTPKKGIDYFTKKELSEIRKTIKEAILSEIPKIITEDEINVKFEDILKKIKNLPTGGGGALFLRQLMDVNVGNPTAQQYGLTYNPSRSEFSLSAISANGVWGTITGTLSDQTDLQNALDSKVESVVAGTNISVDNTDPQNPIVNSLSDRYRTTSSTSQAIVPTGTLSFTVSANLAYIPDQDVIIVYDINNHMHGTVVSYSGTTLTVDIQHKTGSGTYASWLINLDGVPVDAITGSGTTNEIAYFSGGTVIGSLSTSTYPSLTELSYVKGATSSIQTQITGKVTKTGDTMTGTLTNSQTTTASPVDGFVASTSSTATSGNQKASTATRWTASGWKSSSPTSARQIDWRAWVLPEQATSNEPTAIWKLQSQVNNGGWTDHFWIDNKVGGLGAYFNTSGSNGSPGTTRAITINNTGSYSWLDWTFSGTRKVAIGANSSGGFDIYMSGGNYLGLVNGNSNTLYSYIYPTALYHTGDGYFGGRVNAGLASYPSSILSSTGSFASKAIRVTSNYTLTVNESVVYVDASSAACSGTPTYSCSHWTNQTDCEKWDAHGGCTWFAGNPCSDFNNTDVTTCESGHSGCTYDTASCSAFGDESSCNGQTGCSWTSHDCSVLSEGSCGVTSGCTVNTADCSTFNGNESGCSGQSGCSVNTSNTCPSQMDEGSCVGAGCSWDGMTCTGDNSTCTGTYYTGCTGTYYDCQGTYYTGTCSGTYGAACQGTSTCSGIDDSTNCGFETGCSWSTAATINLPQITTVPYRHYWVYNDSSSGADVILTPYSGDQIDKTTSYTLANYKDSVHIQAFYETTSCGSFNEGACTPSGCTKEYANCTWDSMGDTCSGNAVCTGIGDQTTCESTTYFSYCSGNYYSIKNWYLLSRS